MSDVAPKVSKKLYKSIILEIRPRLQSVNVIVSLLNPIEEKKVKIVLTDTNFVIRANETISPISCKNLKISANTLTSLNITDTCISFRFGTDNGLNDWGTFKSELLRVTQPTSVSKESTTFLTKAKHYLINCKNCSQNLGEDMQFDRILPLPSENVEPGDWFCHDHGSSQELNLDPKTTDIFYTQCYFHIARPSIKNILANEKLIVCKRCLSWVGLVENSQTLKIWFNTVTFKSGDTSFNSSPLLDVFSSVQSVLKTVLLNCAKIMFRCQSCKGQVDYVLLWILEKQLNVQIHETTGVIQDCKVAKVLFRCECNFSEIVRTWENDTAVTVVEISKPMMVAALKHLHHFNKIFPKEFSQSNDFYVSYLMMYEDSNLQ